MTLSNLFFGKTIISVGVTQGDFSILSAFAGHTGPARGGMPKTWLDRSVVMSRPTVAADNTGVPVGPIGEHGCLILFFIYCKEISVLLLFQCSRQ